jgi:hypothetical protein
MSLLVGKGGEGNVGQQLWPQQRHQLLRQWQQLSVLVMRLGLAMQSM